MNLSSALIKQVLKLNDFDTWARVRKHYLATEYHTLFESIDKHVTKYHKLPSVEELKLAVRDRTTLDKVYALDGIDTDAEPFLLLDYLKNEYAQKEALWQLDKWVDSTIAFESAEEVVKSLHTISMDIEKKVEIQPESESMQKISLFESEDERAKRIKLGFNEDFDNVNEFLSTDYIMVGGRRGAGKSILCNNVARNVTKSGKTGLYFSIEMMPREVLQRDVSIATQIPFGKIRNKQLSVMEWEQIATFWASRYENGAEHLATYMDHRDFERFHKSISREPLSGPQVDIIYDPVLNLGRIRAELDKRMALDEELGIVVVDYINKVRRHASSSDYFDWKEQIEISTALKSYAQIYGVPFFSPYQIDASGEARFAKGILDPADAAFVMTPHDNCVTFDVTKMRAADDKVSFTSEMNWATVTVGPKSVDPPEPEEKTKDKLKGKKGDKIVNSEVYDDDPPF